MKVGDLVQIKSRAFYTKHGYNTHLFDEKMLVTEIIDELILPDECAVIGIDRRVMECVSESGVHRFPMTDMEMIVE